MCFAKYLQLQTQIGMFWLIAWILLIAWAFLSDGIKCFLVGWTTVKIATRHTAVPKGRTKARLRREALERSPTGPAACSDVIYDIAQPPFAPNGVLGTWRCA